MPIMDGSPAREVCELLSLFYHLSPVVDGVVVHFVEELHLVAKKGFWRLHIVCQRYRASTDLAGYCSRRLLLGVLVNIGHCFSFRSTPGMQCRSTLGLRDCSVDLRPQNRAQGLPETAWARVLAGLGVKWGGALGRSGKFCKE